MSQIPALVDTIIRLKRTTQADLAERTGIHQSNLSRFLAGATDIRTSALVKILRSLELSLEAVLENEIERLIGKKRDTKSFGHAIEVLLQEADPISARTFIDSLSSRVKAKPTKDVSSALEIVRSYKAQIGANVNRRY